MLVAQLYPTLCDPMNCRPPGSSVHEILQARILEWVAMPSSRGSSQPRDWTLVSHIAGRFFTCDKVWIAIPILQMRKHPKNRDADLSAQGSSANGWD